MVKFRFYLLKEIPFLLKFFKLDNCFFKYIKSFVTGCIYSKKNSSQNDKIKFST